MKGDTIVAAPANYNDAGMVIRVDPGAMFQGANLVITQANGIMDNVNRVVDIFNNLTVGWVGTTSAEAQDFGNRFDQSVQNLANALQEMGQGTAQAAINYAVTERINAEMFESLGFSLASADPNGPPPRNSNDGPISENAPPPP